MIRFFYLAFISYLHIQKSKFVEKKRESHHHTMQHKIWIAVIIERIHCWISSIGCIPCGNRDFSTDFNRNSSWYERKSKFFNWSSFLYQMWCITIILEKIFWPLHSFFQRIVTPVRKKIFRANYMRDSSFIVKYEKFIKLASVFKTYLNICAKTWIN